MSSYYKKVLTVSKAIRLLGFRATFNYARYRTGLITGYYRRAVPGAQAYKPFRLSNLGKIPIFIPSPSSLHSSVQEKEKWLLIKEADEIASGRVRLFGGEAVPLKLIPPQPLHHWTEYELGRRDWGVEDVKYLWEPARFGWAFTLGRAYILSGGEKYAQAYWFHAEEFLEANPPNLGPNWTSAQEAALRLIAFAFSLKVFAASPETTRERVDRLAGAIAAHAERIPATLSYSKAQYNNHLLTEAAGLFTAGCTLYDHPSAPSWRRLGWRLFHQAINNQINEDGVYVQHSVNYHRLMLQTALWMQMLVKSEDPPPSRAFPENTTRKLSAAVQWLLKLVDQETGQTPNLGPNDGAYIFPLTSLPFSDHRPVLQAASAAFTGSPFFQELGWDEMSEWFNCRPALVDDPGTTVKDDLPRSPHVLHSPRRTSWAYLRAANFTTRPGHADQLHLDLWWRGLNVALDPGTYLYNAPHPWENALAHTAVHNTITIDGEDQMTRAGRFLWLDWAQARVLPNNSGAGDPCTLSAEHRGYLRKGIVHQRKVAAASDGSWEITDKLLADPPETNLTQAHLFRLHWLLPDWPWEWSGGEQTGKDREVIFSHRLRLKSPLGWITLIVESGGSAKNEPPAALIVRAGNIISGEGAPQPTWGWFSPTYSHKAPALSLSITSRGSTPFSFFTRWIFPGENSSG